MRFYYHWKGVLFKIFAHDYVILRNAYYGNKKQTQLACENILLYEYAYIRILDRFL